MHIRPLESAEEQRLVARRMRDTLVEVLGAERGEAMYTLEWLVGRVGEHLGRADAAVFLAEQDGAVLGHTIVRIEQTDAGTPLGLFSTTYVAPDARRMGVAGALLAHGEDWMRGHRLPAACTWTAHDNAKLIGLYTRRGYRIAEHSGEMVRLERRLAERVR